MRRARRQVDDRAHPGRDHLRQHRAHRVIGADQGDFDVAPPSRGLAVREETDRLDYAGVVDQDVDRSELPVRFSDRRIQRGVIGDVAGDAEGAAAARDNLIGNA